MIFVLINGFYFKIISFHLIFSSSWFCYIVSFFIFLFNFICISILVILVCQLKLIPGHVFNFQVSI